MSLRLFVLLAVTFPLFSSFAAPNHVDDRFALTHNIYEINSSGVPGAICVFGPNAFPVVAGREGKALLPVVAAARWEKGRVVAFGHGGFLTSVTDHDTGKMLLNAVAWSAG